MLQGFKKLVSTPFTDLAIDLTSYEATFHPFFGPMLMVTYACLSNTLLLTVLVSVGHRSEL